MTHSVPTRRSSDLVAGDVHAMIEFSRRVRNSIVGLQSSGIAYTIPQKLDALTAHIWNSKAENGSSVTVVIAHILYGGPDDLLPERLWEAVADPKWKQIGRASCRERVCQYV